MSAAARHLGFLVAIARALARDPECTEALKQFGPRMVMSVPAACASIEPYQRRVRPTGLPLPGAAAHGSAASRATGYTDKLGVGRYVGAAKLQGRPYQHLPDHKSGYPAQARR